MAVTAKFLADFASFTNAVEKADVQLKGMETSAGRVGKSLNAMVDSFSGRKLIQDATIAAEAVERIGGTSKLTASELSRVQGQAVEAAAKLRAMGLEVPPGIQRITDTVKATGSGLESMKGILGSVAGAFGIAFSVGAVVNFGRQVFATASRINDLSSQLGISTDAVQGFKYAAEQSGSSLDDVGTAITKMNVNLAGGDQATVQALRDAGLEFSEIRRKKPEDAFLAIADAIKDIPDPMTRSDVALQIFGRSAAKLLPGMTEGFRELSDSATKMSADTIKRLEAAEDTWDRVATNVTIWSGEVLAAVVKAFSQPPNESAYLQKWLDALHLDVREAKSQLSDLGRWLDTLRGKVEALKEPAGPQKPIGDPLGLSNISVDEMLRIGDALDKERDAANRAAEAHDRHATATAAAAKTIREFGVAVDQGMIPQVRRIGVDVPIATGHLTAFGDAVTKIQGLTKNGIIPDAPARLGVDVGLPVIPKAPPPLEPSFWQKLLNPSDKNHPLYSEANRLGMGVVDSLAQGIRSGDWKGAFKDIGNKVSSFLGSAIASGVNALVPGLGTMLEPIFGALISKIGGLFDRNKGRDIVKEFADSLGGFDSLHKQLNLLGDEGERLWIKLTQGVGRNNKDQAKAAVDEVTAALEAHKKKQEEVATAAEKVGNAESEAYKKAKDAISTLDREIQTLSDSIAGEAPEEFMGIVEQQTRARIDALTKERDTAAKTLEDLTGTLTDSVDEVAQAIRDIPKEIEIRIRTEFDGRPTPPTPGFALGGRVLPFSTGGRVPSATDTVPALLTPGEIVLNAAQQKTLAGAMAGQITIHVNGAGDPKAVADAIMLRLRREKRMQVA